MRFEYLILLDDAHQLDCNFNLRHENYDLGTVKFAKILVSRPFFDLESS